MHFSNISALGSVPIRPFRRTHKDDSKIRSTGALKTYLRSAKFQQNGIIVHLRRNHEEYRRASQQISPTYHHISSSQIQLHHADSGTRIFNMGNFQNWGSSTACRNFPPSPGECALMSYTGVGTIVAPGGLDDSLGSQAAILLNDVCEPIDVVDYEPQNPGFHITLHLPSGNAIDAGQCCLGPAFVGPTNPTINGITPSFVRNSQTRSVNSDLGITWYRQANYLVLDLGRKSGKGRRRRQGV
jgi:hypothetical protein